MTLFHSFFHSPFQPCNGTNTNSETLFKHPRFSGGRNRENHRTRFNMHVLGRNIGVNSEHGFFYLRRIDEHGHHGLHRDNLGLHLGQIPRCPFELLGFRRPRYLRNLHPGPPLLLPMHQILKTLHGFLHFHRAGVPRR